MQRALMLYDGLCGFCNATVQWLLKHDHRDVFRFAPQQSSYGEAALLRHGIDRDKIALNNSVYLLLDFDTPDERVLTHSQVTIECLRMLGGGWGIAGRCLALVPRFVRDAGYRFVAKNRFRVAGRYEACPVPTPEQRTKFLGI